MLRNIIIATIATVSMFFVLRLFSIGLVTDYSPYGIVSFELAKTFDDAKAIIIAVGKRKLQVHTALDFLFIVAYTLLLFSIIKVLVEKLVQNGSGRFRFLFLELSVLVGVLDLIENIAMLITLGGYGSNISVQISYWAAIAKFSILALVLFYIVTVLVYLLFTKKIKA